MEREYIIFLGGIIVAVIAYFFRDKFKAGKLEGAQDITNDVFEKELLAIKKDIDKIKMENRNLEVTVTRHDQSLLQHRKETEYFLKALRDNTEVTHEMKGTLQQLKELFERLLDGDIKIK